ncbi:hypothetical protein [Amycolatopsis speibonae]|uniref:Uncharacterized protein n=1 Tax=Amycolatopsis speibonae TaxID=1450224 RepID=A0ABV7P198_9PSEU
MPVAEAGTRCRKSASWVGFPAQDTFTERSPTLIFRVPVNAARSAAALLLAGDSDSA